MTERDKRGDKLFDTENPGKRMMSLGTSYKIALNPLVTDLSRFFASQYQKYFNLFDRHSQLSPANFTGNASHYLNIFRTHGSYEKEEELAKIPQQFLHLKDNQLATLYLGVPVIARLCFPKEFADVVEERWDNTLKYYGYEVKLPNRIVDEILPIDEEIRSATMAKAQIIDNAEGYVAGLDWRWAIDDDSLSDDRVRALFKESLPFVSVSREFGTRLPLRVISALDQDASALSDRQKCFLNRDWLLVTEDNISPEQATFTQDFLSLMSMVPIARALGMSPDEAELIAGRLLTTNQGLQQSYQRMMEFMVEGTQ